MQRLALLPILALSAATVSAQADHFTPSPNGFTGVEGSTSLDLIGKEATLRFQQVDATNLAGKTNRNRMAFRRDGVTGLSPASVSRTLDLEVSWADGNLATFSSNFAANISGNQTVVFARKNIVAPDWTVQNGTPQASSDWFYIPFDAGVIHNYNYASGVDLLWEVKCWANTAAGTSYPMDADPVIQTEIQGPSARYGTPCTAPGQTSAMNSHSDAYVDGTNLRLEYDISRAAPNQPWLTLWGLAQQSPGLVLPGMCGSGIGVSQIVRIPIHGLTDGTGAGSAQETVAYQASYQGANIFCQQVAFDPGQGPQWPFGFAWNRQVTIPGAPSPNSQCKYAFALSASATTATTIAEGGTTMFSNHP